jgi:hypothetical protein
MNLAYVGVSQGTRPGDQPCKQYLVDPLPVARDLAGPGVHEPSGVSICFLCLEETLGDTPNIPQTSHMY